MIARNEQLKSLMLGFVLSLGAAVIWVVLTVIGYEAISTVFGPRNVFEQLMFLYDGTPIIQSYLGGDYTAGIYRTLDGKPVEVTSSEYGASLPSFNKRRENIRDLAWAQRLVFLSDDRYGSEAWYLVYDDNSEGHGYLVGYDRLSKMRIGYMGRNGFRVDQLPLDEQFSIDRRRVSPMGLGQLILNRYGDPGVRLKYVSANDGLWQIDMRRRAVELLWKDTNLVSAAMSHKARTNATSSEWIPTILLRTPDQVHVLDADGKEIAAYRLPEELRDTDLRWIALQGGKALVHTSHENASDDCKNELFWIDTSGRILRHEHVKLSQQLGHRDPATTLAMPAMLPVPLVGIGIFLSYPWAANVPETVAYSEALERALREVWPTFVLLTVIGIVMAGLCYRRQRKYGLPWTGVWTAFVLLFGVPAYLGYLAHRSWPVRLACPNCGKLAPRDREACFACGREFPAPAAKGIEVFA